MLFPCHVLTITKNSFGYSGAVLWNSLPSTDRWILRIFLPAFRISEDVVPNDTKEVMKEFGVH